MLFNDIQRFERSKITAKRDRNFNRNISNCSRKKCSSKSSDIRATSPNFFELRTIKTDS